MDSLADGNLASTLIHSYQGIARVSLRSLNFEHRLARDCHRELSPDNVQRLRQVFEKNGCLRLQEENVINAIIDEDVLAAALSTISCSADNLRSIRWAQDAPFLRLDNVDCLSGLHRIRAAEHVLDENDKWWVVRLFSPKTPEGTLNRLIESYGHEQKPSDGEIFRKIRFYHRQKDQDAEHRWWACLNKTKPRDLRQLLKRPSLISAFDRLIDMPGLWVKIQLGALHRLLGLKCEEEMVSYLERTAKFWKGVLAYGGIAISPSCVDVTTVEHLELRAPQYSVSDREFLQDCMRRKELFPSIIDDQVRNALLGNILRFSGVIPSLRTFFEMLKYIEPICFTLKQLIGDNMKSTIRKSLLGNHWRPAKVVVHSSELEEVEIKIDLSKTEAARVAYFELWAFCARHFDTLTTFTPKKESKDPKPVHKGPNPVSWQRLARLALKLGFRLPNAQRIAEEDPYSQLASDFLHKISPITSSFGDEEINKIVKAALDTRRHAISGSEIPELNDPHMEKDRRSGRPYERDLIEDKMTLFFPTLFFERPDKRDFQFQGEDFGKSTLADLDTYHPPITRIDVLPNALAKHPLQERYLALVEAYEQTTKQREESQQSSELLLSRYDTLESEYAVIKRKHDSLLSDYENVKRRCTELEQDNKQLRAHTMDAEERKTRELQYTTLLQQYENLQKTYAAQASSTPLGNTNRSSVERIIFTLADITSHQRCRSDPHGHHGLFIACSNDTDGDFKGCVFEIDPEAASAHALIETLIDTTKKQFRDQIKAMTVHGKYLTVSADFILQSYTTERTIVIGPHKILETYLQSRANERGLQVSHTTALVRVGSVGPVPRYKLKNTKRRRLHDSDEDGSDAGESEAEELAA